MVEKQKKTETWEVRKLGKVAEKFDNHTAAQDDAQQRNDAASLLGVSVRYTVIKQTA